VDSMFALARAAEQSAGIALVPMPVSKSWFESGALVPLHDSPLVTEDCYWMAMSDHAEQREVVATFWDWMLLNLQDHARTIDEFNSSVA